MSLVTFGGFLAFAYEYHYVLSKGKGIRFSYKSMILNVYRLFGVYLLGPKFASRMICTIIFSFFLETFKKFNFFFC